MAKIYIPWYQHDVRIGNFINVSRPVSGFDIDIDRKKKKKGDTKKGETPNLNPNPVTVEVKVNETVAVQATENTTETIESLARNPMSTPVPVVLPSRLPNLGGIPDALGRGRTGDGNIPNTGTLNAGMKFPGGEVLFKLAEAEPTGRYDNALNTYNDVTLSVMWNVMNPFFTYSRPTYKEVNKFLATHDMEEMKDDDIKNYFRELRIKGVDLETSPARVIAFYSTVKTLSAVEDILVYPIQDKTSRRIY